MNYSKEEIEKIFNLSSIGLIFILFKLILDI
jgi:predicted naringenin-chalcone synthase